MTFRLLAVGDIHLGRTPARLHPELDAPALGPEAAWRRTVDAAINQRVDAVVLAGDVVEEENDFFVAYRALRDGVARLDAAGIRVVGVAGNHDTRVLPRLADELPAFTLLGRGGQWEKIELSNQAGAGVELWGWSFPQPHVSHSPLAGQALARGQRVTLGLLHCDRDVAGSRYAPVTSAELQGAGLDGWLLGHIHRPDALQAPAPCGYLGSLSGLHPGEHGARGPWLLEIGPARVERVTHWPLAPLRWARSELSLDGLPEAEAVRTRLLEHLNDYALPAEPEWRPQAVGLRLTLTGRSRHRRGALALLAGDVGELLTGAEAGVDWFIERLDSRALPELDMAELAAEDNPAGLLARRLRQLDEDGDVAERSALIAAARECLRDLSSRGAHWQTVSAELDDSEITRCLRAAATAALDALLAQRGEGGE